MIFFLIELIIVNYVLINASFKHDLRGEVLKKRLRVVLFCASGALYKQKEPLRQSLYQGQKA